MTSHVARLYATAAAIAVFFVAWAGLAARPWASTERKVDPRVAALEARAKRVDAQRAALERLLAVRPAAPSVRVVTLPAITQTRSS